MPPVDPGHRWGLTGAEAVLKLRTLIDTGDFDTRWPCYLAREHHRIPRDLDLAGYILAA